MTFDDNVYIPKLLYQASLRLYSAHYVNKQTAYELENKRLN